MSTEHLGERISALVDGELGPAERDRALIHLASCDPCRFEADMSRRLKRRLNGLDCPGPSSDFLGRLSALGAGGGDPSGPPGPSAPGDGRGVFGGPPPLGSSRPIGGGLPARPQGRGAQGAADPGRRIADSAPRPPRTPSALRPGWPGARYALAGASALALTLGTAFVAGGEDDRAPLVSPSFEDFAVEHALTAAQVALQVSDAGEDPGDRDRDATADAEPAVHAPEDGTVSDTPRVW